MGQEKKQAVTKEFPSVLTNILSALKGFLLASQSFTGFDIGTSYIKIAQLRKSGPSYLISDYRVRAFPGTTKENPQERKKFIQGFVTEFLSESRSKASSGRLALWGGGTYIFSISVPGASEKELKNIVAGEMKKKLPFQVDLSNIVSNYFVTDKTKDDKGEIAQVTCIAMDKYILEENLKVFKEIGVDLTTINVMPDVLGNLVNAISKDAQIIAVLDMGAKESVFNFYKKGLLQFSRQIPLGGNQFTQGILKAMMTLGMTNATEEEAEKVKRQCGVPLEEDVFLEYFTDLGAIKGNQISVALRPILERFNTEITRTINYYYRTFHIQKLDCLYLSGGASRLKNIDKYLEFNIQNLNIVRLERLNPLSTLKGWTDSGVARRGMVMEEAAPHLSAAIGLCINKGGKVNLLPPKEMLAQKISLFAKITRITFFVFLAVILGIYAFTYYKCLLYDKYTKTAEADIVSLQPRVDKIHDYLAMKGILTERKSLLSNVIGRQPLWYGLLKELSLITPKGILLTGIEIRRSKEKREISLTGEVYAEYTTIELAFSEYFVALRDSPFFTNVRPVKTERDVFSPVPKANFKIVCDLVY